MKVVFDTNILIAAALKGGFSEDLLKMASTQTIVLICSEAILAELYQKMTTKFEWDPGQADFFISTIKEISEIVEIKQPVTKINSDPDDNKILECALAGQADLIVSSDQHLIKLKNWQGIGIVHPNTLNWIFPEYFKRSV